MTTSPVPEIANVYIRAFRKPYSVPPKSMEQQVIDLGKEDLGKEHQMVLELRPSHDPNRTYGFAGVVISLKDLSASIWLSHRDNGK